MAGKNIAEPCVQWQVLQGMSIASVRRMAGDRDVLEILKNLGMRWPESTGNARGDDPVVLWKRPSEALVVSKQAGRTGELVALLEAGRSPSGIALDVSEQITVLEVRGPALNEWLAQVVDTYSLPQRGGVTNARLAEIHVLIFRPEDERVWILVERTLVSYLDAWLCHTRDVAFSVGVVQ
ncbi:hypothetical protein [Bordetella sp. BOR01]|uniref:hypothetical protein n=1 Tax=Bordetella sp. BOR01 TaxID=2854779 RepID=UPI001C43F6B4|nr:hypothetical protein [Bordetella sp. BOR01]MBV7482224.1 hypothetical protein [Bordetella sp. BOR01]